MDTEGGKNAKKEQENTPILWGLGISKGDGNWRKEDGQEK
jgi:hypothetical protein